MSAATTIGYCLILGLAVAITRPGSAQGEESAFAAMEKLGTHRFEDAPDGGRIELTRDPGDSAGIAEVRAHLARIASDFAAGNFSKPGEVHEDKEVPGAATMAARRNRISYRYSPVTGGGELRIVTRDPEALKAVYQYLAFQRREHTHQH
ncbi:MAG TPA: hypothetical protein VFB61_04870 [Gemmatimonadales bacterium]|nr:hypothetical protein [Gemmatimonadales bacterium]